MQYPDFQSYFKSLSWRDRRRIARDAMDGRVGEDPAQATILRDYCHFRLTNKWEQPWVMPAIMVAFSILGALLLPSLFEPTTVIGIVIAAVFLIPLSTAHMRRKLSRCMEANHRALAGSATSSYD
jgi:hypothetical protein